MVAAGGDVELEQLDLAGADWYAEGPGGVACGNLAEVLGAACAPRYEQEWLDAVLAGLARELEKGPRRNAILIKRGGATMFHASRSRNRQSIARHGLDWRRMTDVPGIAGSGQAEHQGVFLCEDLEGARWFAGMPRGETADIWSVRTDEQSWLISDPGASGGLDDAWMICPAPIPATRVSLLEHDVPTRNW